MTQISYKVADYLITQRLPMIDLLKEMVEAESPSARPDSHQLMRAALRSQFDKLGYLTRQIGSDPGPRHIFARQRSRREGAAIQLVVGHFDTVWPLGTVAKRPFSVDGNIIRGPGTFDMKGGLVQIILALRTMEALNLEPQVSPVIFLNSDEEIGSRSSTRWVRMLAKASDRALVLEPAMGERGDIKTERKGIGKFTVTVFGMAAHAGLDPEGGASAILELSHLIQKLFALNDVDRGISVNVGTVDGGLQANVIAPHSSAVIDVRVPTVEGGEEITRAIHAIKPETPGIRLKVEGGIGRPSMEHTPRNAALWDRARMLGTELGLDLNCVRAGGGSDGNTTSQFTATLDGLGPVGDGAHAEHEFLYIDETLQRAALLTMLLLSPPETNESFRAKA